MTLSGEAPDCPLMAGQFQSPDGVEWIELENSLSGKKLSEFSLVLSALGLSFVSLHRDHGFELWVASTDLPRARANLDQYRIENSHWPEPRLLPALTLELRPLIEFALLMVGFFVFQNFYGANELAENAGMNSHLLPQIWRASTALFLHANESHFLGNLVMALGLAAALFPLLGEGLTWMGFWVSGVMGNLLNAFFYQHSHHRSIGFSTALFGAVGVWAGARWMASVRGVWGSQKFWSRSLVPLGVGFSVLAAWGASPASDYMAHFWGALVGFAFGVTVEGLRLPKRLSPRFQAWLSLGVLGLVGAAWFFALERARL